MNNIYRIYNLLYKKYGPQKWWPIINNKTLLCEYRGDAPRNDDERFEICVGAVLAQNTSWYPGVVRALQQLKLGRLLTYKELELLKRAEIGGGISNFVIDSSNRKNLLSVKEIKKISKEKIAQLIRPAGYYNQKAEKIKIVAEFFEKYFKNKNIPKREELLKVKGVGPETADSILLYSFEQPYFVIDAYTKRIFSRLGFCEEKCNYTELQNLFIKQLKKDVEIFKEYHALLVEHAKRYCKKNPSCCGCVLRKQCKFIFY